MIIRLRNADTGVIVGVDESKRDRFGEGWELVKASAPPAPVKPAATAAKRSRAKSK